MPVIVDPLLQVDEGGLIILRHGLIMMRFRIFLGMFFGCIGGIMSLLHLMILWGGGLFAI